MSYLLLPLFLFSMFFNCLRAGRKHHILHANWAVCGVVAGLAGKILGKPTVTTLRGDDVTRAKQSVIDYFVLMLCIRVSTKVVCVSDSIHKWVCDQFPMHRENIIMICNGVDNHFIEAKHTTKHGRDNDAPAKLITIGSLIARKGMDVIVEAINNMVSKNRVTLSIVGAGPERDKLLKMIKDHNLADRISLAGEVKPDSIPQLLQEHDMFILASHSEGRPNVLLEAMAAGMPIVASDIEGVKELISDHVTGLLFRAGSPESLGDRLEYLLQHDEIRKKLGEEARKFIINNGLSWTTTAENYGRVYREVT